MHHRVSQQKVARASHPAWAKPQQCSGWNSAAGAPAHPQGVLALLQQLQLLLCRLQALPRRSGGRVRHHGCHERRQGGRRQCCCSRHAGRQPNAGHHGLPAAAHGRVKRSRGSCCGQRAPCVCPLLGLELQGLCWGLLLASRQLLGLRQASLQLSLVQLQALHCLQGDAEFRVQTLPPLLVPGSKLRPAWQAWQARPGVTVCFTVPVRRHAHRRQQATAPTGCRQCLPPSRPQSGPAPTSRWSASSLSKAAICWRAAGGVRTAALCRQTAGVGGAAHQHRNAGGPQPRQAAQGTARQGRAGAAAAC